MEVNGEPANVSDGTFTIDLPLEGGTRSVEVAVTNLDNLVTRSTITLDVEQPWTLEVESHVDGQITYQSNPMVFGAVHESIDQIRVNGRPAVLESGSFRFGYLCENTGQESSPHCDYASYDDRLELDEGQHVLTVGSLQGWRIAGLQRNRPGSAPTGDSHREPRVGLRGPG
ncbi:hypothetical protein [Microbulbifer halophilus]|uniref:hypothetical protein n=1 Tax=Microbulbifer halophilus TaxID=453963 RepID=UPI003605AD11